VAKSFPMAGTVVDELRERAAVFAHRPAIVDADESFSYAALFERVTRLASALAALGVRKGDAILAYLPNVHEAVECELAALESGIVWITLTSRLTWAEVRGVVAACAPKLVVTDAGGLSRIALGVTELPLAPLPGFVVTRAQGAELPLPAHDYEALIGRAGAKPPVARVGPEDVARLRYTSGTTGGAKAAVLPHRVYHASLRNLLHELGPFTEEDRALHVAPLTHGSGALLYPVLYAGGANVLVQQFDPEGMLADIERHRVSVLFTVPTILSRIVSSPDFERRDLSSLRALAYGGAPMPEGQLRAAVMKIGHALYQIYGMTEAPWPITTLKPADHLRALREKSGENGRQRLTSAGKPTIVCDVRVVDEAGRALSVGGVGEIQIRGQNVMSGYHEDLEGTAQVLQGGWLSSGDVGTFDAEGYLYIVGRAKDVIISGGFNVYAAEVEAALSTHDAVLEAAVVGVPHDDWGEQVVAFVVPRPGTVLTEAMVHAFAKSRLSGYKCPKRVQIATDLPKNPSGKIQKGELRLRANAGG
jgi:long-chain acyl-CoA synthetase